MQPGASSSEPPPLLIAGSQADSLYMTEAAFAKATGARDKALFKIDGATGCSMSDEAPSGRPYPGPPQRH